MGAHDVLVVGCGLMGTALARSLAVQGHAVAAWNRTSDKAEAVGGGVTAVADLSGAVRQARIVLSCTSTYDTTRDVLASVVDWGSAALVNVGTGSPDEAEAMSVWARERGIDYLDGAILCYPQHIGTSDALILYSGSVHAWSEHSAALASLGPSSHVSADPRGASVLDVTMAGGFYITALAAYVEAASYALDQGIAVGDLRGVTDAVIGLLGSATDDVAHAVETGRHDTDQATVAVFAAGARLCRDAMRSAGRRADLLHAAADLLTSAEDAGLGESGFSAIATVAS
ncbi:6-phosphogluconate dehydrogenase [Gordonia spumicola]|uniref:6-phosphogluconate dehydrogenase n=1 Tax=Gordonia spumicola TaxID=589161 RepID=A0A7I9VFG7_9ACTN|nr:NAD(P)-binding domain-containing protein [Gordonia spumicola]GED99566.1 6-phosphogluconate dehydrogenase [Gordonia spumicola]GEE04108.1 6-phosphogluconate dehydrogenase [Gordonia spumicola]GEE04119.1 6-phosphogluconate dehydrogenase [Gordonia spumicola]